MLLTSTSCGRGHHCISLCGIIVGPSSDETRKFTLGRLKPLPFPFLHFPSPFLPSHLPLPSPPPFLPLPTISSPLPLEVKPPNPARWSGGAL